MVGTGNWYCARCSRFVDNALIYCEGCSRMRGSSRIREGATQETALYWLRVHSPPEGADPPPEPESNPPPQAGKPTGLVPTFRSAPPPDGRRSRP